MKKGIFLLLLLTGILVSCNNKQTQQTQQASPATHKAISLTKDDFLTKVFNYNTSPQELKYLGDKPAVVDFYATWCGPCKVMSPTLEKLAAEYEGKVYVYKIDVDKEQELASVFGIQSIPTLFFIPMSGDLQVARGIMQEATLRENIENILNK